MDRKSFDEIKESYIENAFNELVDLYHDAHKHDQTFYPNITEFAALLPRRARVLDVGCGSGGDSKKLVENGLEVIGIDLSRKMISRAKKEVERAEFKRMDMIKMTFEEGVFDGVWVAKALSNVPSKEVSKAVKEIKRVLKPGGVLGVAVLAENGGEGREGVEVDIHDPRGKIKAFYKYFTKKEIEEDLKRAGFEIISDYLVRDYIEKRDYLILIARA
jgi:ubiquinone/menaquinone biosynthesis C-methylase UbiE